MRWVKPILIITAIMLGLCFVYELRYPDYSFRYRLQFTFMAQGASSTGSSVIEVHWLGRPAGDLTYRAEGSLKGQAPLIDLGDGGVLIASLAGGNASLPNAGVSALFLGPRAFGNDSAYHELPKLSHYKGRQALTEDNWPRILWLPDRSNPNSVRDMPRHLLESEFGHGARFTEAFVEVTGDPVTIEIEKTLPWYPQWAARWLSTDLRIYNPPNVLTLYPFMLNGVDR